MASERISYQVVDIKPGFFGIKSQQLQDELNRLGQQGWELIAVQPMGLNTRLFLKKGQ
ncbi:MAG TPA: DUF4177 domain-containing protein [Arenimonas sp.]|nr:DUF4177 domain-containing protein [Arenimonas sp.]